MIILYNGYEILCCDEFSGRDFTCQTLLNSNLNGRVIYGSCFSQEIPDTEVFSSGLVATFLNCNLDNVKVPVGCTVQNCSQRRFMAQSDGLDWFVDENNNPISLKSRVPQISE